MKLRVLLVGVLLAVAVVGAGPVHACGEGETCALINRICDRVAGPCIP